MKRIISGIAALIAAFSCTPKQENAHPDWTYDAVVYEMNIRQYTPEWTSSGLCPSTLSE